MIKGFLQKVLAFEKFLEENEELDSEYKVVLLQCQPEVTYLNVRFISMVYNLFVPSMQITRIMDMQNIYLLEWVYNLVQCDIMLQK